jgi:hypothetical protein
VRHSTSSETNKHYPYVAKISDSSSPAWSTVAAGIAIDRLERVPTNPPVRNYEFYIFIRRRTGIHFDSEKKVLIFSNGANAVKPSQYASENPGALIDRKEGHQALLTQIHIYFKYRNSSEPRDNRDKKQQTQFAVGFPVPALLCRSMIGYSDNV